MAEERYCLTTADGRVTSTCFAFKNSSEIVAYIDNIEPATLTRIDARKYNCTSDNVCTLKPGFSTSAPLTAKVAFQSTPANKSLFNLVGDVFDGQPKSCMAKCAGTPFLSLEDKCVCLNSERDTIQAVAALSRGGYCSANDVECIRAFDGSDSSVSVPTIDTAQFNTLTVPPTATLPTPTPAPAPAPTPTPAATPAAAPPSQMQSQIANIVGTDLMDAVLNSGSGSPPTTAPVIKPPTQPTPPPPPPQPTVSQATPPSSPSRRRFRFFKRSKSKSPSSGSSRFSFKKDSSGKRSVSVAVDRQLVDNVDNAVDGATRFFGEKKTSS